MYGSINKFFTKGHTTTRGDNGFAEFLASFYSIGKKGPKESRSPFLYWGG